MDQEGALAVVSNRRHISRCPARATFQSTRALSLRWVGMRRPSRWSRPALSPNPNDCHCQGTLWRPLAWQGVELAARVGRLHRDGLTGEGRALVSFLPFLAPHFGKRAPSSHFPPALSPSHLFPKHIPIDQHCIRHLLPFSCSSHFLFLLKVVRLPVCSGKCLVIRTMLALTENDTYSVGNGWTVSCSCPQQRMTNKRHKDLGTNETGSAEVREGSSSE